MARVRLVGSTRRVRVESDRENRTAQQSRPNHHKGQQDELRAPMKVQVFINGLPSHYSYQ